MLKTLGFFAWGCCLLTLVYQSIAFVLFKSWPELDLLTTLHSLFGFDLLSIIDALPLEVAAKTAYACFTTELSLFFWWMGVIFFGLLFSFKTICR